MPDIPNTPQSNVEKYLAAQAGQSVSVPAVPSSRVEQYLAEILRNQGGSLTIPTKTSDLTNDSGFQNETEVLTAIRSELAGVVQVEWRVVNDLPGFGELGVVYLVSNNGTDNNIYDEYLWLSAQSKYEKIGTTEVDLSGYALSSDVNTALSGKVDKVTGKGLSTNDYTDAEKDLVHSALQAHQDISGLVPKTTMVNGKSLSGSITLNKADIGLGSVDNTADSAKPVSTAQQAALDTKVDKVTGKGLSANDLTDERVSELTAATSVNNRQNKELAHLTERFLVLQQIIEQVDPTVTKSATGNPVIIADGYNGAALVSAAVDSNLSGESITLTRYGVTRNGETNPTTQTVAVGATGAVSTAITLTTLLGENVIYAYHGQTAVSLTVAYRADPRYMQHDTYPTETTSGNPVTIEDGADAVPVKSLTAQITPGQAGSGDPYPPGGGKNLLGPHTSLPDSYNSNGVTFTVRRDSAGNIVEVTATGTASQNSFIDYGTFTPPIAGSYILSGAPGGGCVLYRWNPGYAGGDGSDVGSGHTINVPENYVGASYPVRIVVNAGTSVNSAVFRPMVRRASDTDPTFAPYSNIRPISGVSSVTVTRTGKNILPFEKTQSGYSVEFPALTLPAGTYSFSYGTTGADAGPWQTYLKRNDERHVMLSNTYRGTFTLSEPTLVKLWIWREGSAVPIDNIVWAQLEHGSETTDYAEYKGTATVTVPLTDGSNPLTIGGGTLNVTTGELTVTHRYYTLSPDDVTMIAGQDGSASGYFAAYLTGVLSDYPAYHRAGTANLLDFLCDTLTPLFVYSQYTSRGIYIYDTASLPGLSNICLRVHISDVPGWTGGTTVNDSMNIIKQFLTDTPVSICYQLATPITYQLTPQEVTTLLGVNTIAADCGAVSVTYRSDPTLALSE